MRKNHVRRAAVCFAAVLASAACEPSLQEKLRDAAEIAGEHGIGNCRGTPDAMLVLDRYDAFSDAYERTRHRHDDGFEEAARQSMIEAFDAAHAVAKVEGACKREANR